MAKVKAEVSLERREKQSDRRGVDRRKQAVPVATERRQTERRTKQPRRRQIDPTTCERDYSNDEIDFMQAMDAYKRASGRMFPTCSEILEVIRGMGYVRMSQVLTAETPVVETTETTPTATSTL